MYLTICQFMDRYFPGGGLGLLASCAVVVLTRLGSSLLYRRRTMSGVREKIRDRQSKAKETFEKVKSVLQKSKVDTWIVDMPFAELQEKLQKGQLKPSQVLLAFQAKALEVNEDLNCITEFITDAQSRAEQLDAVSPGQVGPLYGIPVSLKEVVGLQGNDCHAGCSFLINKMMCEDSIVVKMLKTLGAVPFCRTNVSQAQMSLSCNNPVYGETRNPIQRHRTCGGSSGGEGALIGGGGSVLGVGCDLGGSIRVPSHFCGTVGVKGTPKRISGAGSCPLGQEIVTVSEVYGPLGRDVDAVLAFYSSMLSPSVCTMDPLIPPLPWRHELYTKTSPMRIGFYTHDGCVLPVPAVVRAVHLAKSVLTQLGHTVVEFNPPDVLKALEKLLLPIVCGDKCQTLKENLSNDLVDPDLKETISLYSSPLWLRKLYSKLSNPLHPVSKACLNTKLPGSVANWWKLNEELEAYSRKFVKEWQSLGLDGVICPPFPYTAWPLDNGEKGLLGLMYTGLYNVLGYPCGVLPATVVTADDVISMKQYPNSNDGDKYIQQITVGSEGLPIGVQCVALPYQEETLLRIMKQLETGLREHKI